MSEIDYDTRRGHCYVRADNGRVIASGEATLLGHALISWSAWRRRIIPTIDHYQRTADTSTDDKETR